MKKLVLAMTLFCTLLLPCFSQEEDATKIIIESNEIQTRYDYDFHTLVQVVPYRCTGQTYVKTLSDKITESVKF